MRRKWRIQKDHRGWIKVHLAVDTRRKEILAISITDEKTGDDTGFKDLLNQCKENISDAKIKKVLADGAYDRRSIFNYLRRHGIKSGIKMRKDAKTDSNKSPYRISCIKRRDEIGYNGWKKEVGYTKRWSCESLFSSVKRMLGESVRATSKSGSLLEAYRKMTYYNALNNYGRGKISGI